MPSSRVRWLALGWLVACGSKGGSPGDAPALPDGGGGTVTHVLGPDGTVAPLEDHAPPRFNGVQSVRVLDLPNRVQVTWRAAVDDRTPPEDLVYEVTAAPAGLYGVKLGPGDAVVKTTLPGELSAELDMPLEEIGRDAWVRVRARDAAGNLDDNPVTRGVSLRFPRQPVYPPMGSSILTAVVQLDEDRLLVAGQTGVVAILQEGKLPVVLPPVTSSDYVGLTRLGGQIVGLTRTGHLLSLDTKSGRAYDFDPALPVEGAAGFRAVVADGDDLYVAQTPRTIFRLRGGVWSQQSVEAKCLELHSLRASPAMAACDGGVFAPDDKGDWRVAASQAGLQDAVRLGTGGWFGVDEQGNPLRSAGTEFTKVAGKSIGVAATVWADDSGEAGALGPHGALVYHDEALAALGHPPRAIHEGPGFQVQAALALPGGRLVAVGNGASIFDGRGWRRLQTWPPPTLLGGAGGTTGSVVLEQGPGGLRLVGLDSEANASPLPPPKGAKGFAAVCAGESAVLVADTKGTVFELHGSSWRSAHPPGAKVLRALACRRDEAYAVGPKGYVAHWDGKNWRRVNVKGGEDADLTAVAIGSPGHAVAVGGRGEVLVIEGDRVTKGERVGKDAYRAVAVIGERIFAATAHQVKELDGNGDPKALHKPQSHDPSEPDVELLMLAARSDGTLYVGGTEEMWTLASENLVTTAVWAGTLRGLVPTPDGNLLVITKGAVQRLLLR